MKCQNFLYSSLVFSNKHWTEEEYSDVLSLRVLKILYQKHWNSKDVRNHRLSVRKWRLEIGLVKYLWFPTPKTLYPASSELNATKSHFQILWDLELHFLIQTSQSVWASKAPKINHTFHPVQTEQTQDHWTRPTRRLKVIPLGQSNPGSISTYAYKGFPTLASLLA